MKKTLTFLLLCAALSGFAQDSYILSPESTLTIEGTSTVHDWIVSANAMHGTLTTNGSQPKTINFEVNVADILSERGPTMDNKMHEALKQEEHPTISFKLSKLKNGTILLGLLTIAGVEKNVEIDTKTDTTGDGLKIKGEKKIVLQDFGMEPPTAMFGQIIVGDEVTVKFDLSFSKS